MFTIRDVCVEALARSGLVPRRQPANGKMIETAYQLLRGIAADYSSHNLLQFLRREVDLNAAVLPEDHYEFTENYVTGVNFWFSLEDLPIPSPMYWPGTPRAAMAWDGDTSVARLTVVGAGEVAWTTYNYPTKEIALSQLMGVVFKAIIPGGMQPVLKVGMLDNEEPNDWLQVPVDNLECIKEIYWDRTNDPMANTAIPLSFVSYEDFNNAAYGEYIYTWQAISDTKVEIKFKPWLIKMVTPTYGLKMIYNVKYAFDLDSAMKIPDIYRELFVVALTYKLAVEFPRLSPEHTERLKKTMEEIENSVKSPTRANKLIIREPVTRDGLYNMRQLDSGSFVFPR